MAITEALSRVLRPNDTYYMRALRSVTDEDRDAKSR